MNQFKLTKEEKKKQIEKQVLDEMFNMYVDKMRRSMPPCLLFCWEKK